MIDISPVAFSFYLSDTNTRELLACPGRLGWLAGWLLTGSATPPFASFPIAFRLSFFCLVLAAEES
jgi:hypothetical protein